MIDKNSIFILIGHKNNQFYHPLLILNDRTKHHQRISALYDPATHNFTLTNGDTTNIVHNIQEFRAFIHQSIPHAEYHIRMEHLYDDLIFNNVYTNFSHNSNEKIHLKHTIFPQKPKHRSLIPAPFTTADQNITDHTPFAYMFDHAVRTLRAHYQWIKEYPEIQISDDDILAIVRINNIPDFVIQLHIHYAHHTLKLDICINKNDYVLHRSAINIAIPMDIDTYIHPFILQWCDTTPKDCAQNPCLIPSISRHEHLNIVRALQQHLPPCIPTIMEKLSAMNNILTQHTILHT